MRSGPCQQGVELLHDVLSSADSSEAARTAAAEVAEAASFQVPAPRLKPSVSRSRTHRPSSQSHAVQPSRLGHS
jgi:hypothetical protein